MVRAIAFYLPQFHPIPENDAWWGKGFTEWTNVTRARSLFPGHHQPRLPADMGFYDLRVPQTREAQASLAREHGLDGFCYYHYWFEGTRLLERPFNEVLSSGRPDFPFCLCWANETWSRRWLGEEDAILLAQQYSPEDDVQHARWLSGAFRDPRYLRVDGRPLFLVYRPAHLPAPERTVQRLRDECLAEGVGDPYLVGVNAHCLDTDCRTLGFDRTLQFMPQLGNLPEVLSDDPSETKRSRNQGLGVDSATLKLYDYSEAVASMIGHRHDHPVIPAMFVGWDNTPRRGKNAVVFVNRTPELYEQHLEQILVESRQGEDGLLFINAWNEWAEGNYLEPDQQNGCAFLEATGRVLRRFRSDVSDGQ